MGGEWSTVGRSRSGSPGGEERDSPECDHIQDVRAGDRPVEGLRQMSRSPRSLRNADGG